MVTPYYYPIIGGTETFVETISLKLNELGVHTDIMTFNIDKKTMFWRGKIDNVNGLKVIKISTISFKPLEFFQMNHLPLPFTNKFKEYDVIHFHNDVDLSFPVFSYFSRKPKIFHCHCLDTTYYDCYNWNFIARHLFINTADIYIVLSNFLRKMLIKLGIPESKITVIPNGIDIKKFRLENVKREENTLLFVGRITQKKGLLVLLDSLKYLKTKVKLVIVGSISHDYQYSYDVLDLAKKINDENFHTINYLGVLKLEELIKWYQKASILVLPSISESFPMVVLEALACGTPIIASDVGAVAEVVKNNENGMLVSPNNSVELAKSIQYLLNNADVRRRFSENGRRTIEKQFSIDVVARKLHKVYCKLLSNCN